MTLALWVSVSGVALGVAMLILVLSVMSGFLNFLQVKYTNITSPIVVIPRGEVQVEGELKKIIEAVSGVSASSPFLLGQSMVIKNGVGGVTLEGISWPESERVTPWKEVWWDPPNELPPPKGMKWIWIGKGLAEKLGVKKGDTVELLSGGENMETIPFVVTAITKFGIYEHDLRYSYLDLETLRTLFLKSSLEPLYKVSPQKGFPLDKLERELRESVREKASVKKWSDINKNIFLAVRHQKMMLFWVLDIVVALAGMNVINLLMMSSYQRKRDVAILRAMGMRFKSIVLFFVGQGAIVGCLGVVAGIGLGILLCLGVERFQPQILSEAIYNVSRLPLKIQVADVLLVSGVALLLCVVFSVVPALKAALMRPVQALRYE